MDCKGGAMSKELTKEQIDKVFREFRKVCMRCWTSKEYNYPPKSKGEAELLTMEVCCFLGEALEKLR